MRADLTAERCASHAEHASLAVGLRTCRAMGTRLHRQPQHPQLPAWAQRAQLLLDPGASDLPLPIGGTLILWFLWRGEAASARGVVACITRWIKPSLPAKVGRLWSCAIGVFHSVRGAATSCRGAIAARLALARQSD